MYNVFLLNSFESAFDESIYNCHGVVIIGPGGGWAILPRLILSRAYPESFAELRYLIGPSYEHDVSNIFLQWGISINEIVWNQIAFNQTYCNFYLNSIAPDGEVPGTVFGGLSIDKKVFPISLGAPGLLELSKVVLVDDPLSI